MKCFELFWNARLRFLSETVNIDDALFRVFFLCGSYIVKLTPFSLTPILLTQKINVTILIINTIIYTLVLAPQHIQFTTHYFDFKSKKLYGKRCRSKDPPKIIRKCAENES